AVAVAVPPPTPGLRNPLLPSLRLCHTAIPNSLPFTNPSLSSTPAMATLRPHHLFLLLLHHVLTVCSTVAAFAPEDNFLINCGANATVTSADGRPFRPDTSGEVSSFVMLPISHDVVQVSSSDVNGSARVFREAAAYRFSICTT
ncbi:hypothetical protein BHE74_00042592, partial [Ensete ventricosum]